MSNPPKVHIHRMIGPVQLRAYCGVYAPLMSVATLEAMEDHPKERRCRSCIGRWHAAKEREGKPLTTKNGAVLR